MKQTTSKSMRIISNYDSTAFERDVNAFLDEHKTDISVNVQFTTTTAGHNAYIIYEQQIQIPEDIRDEYILRGEEYHCEDCPYWTNNQKPEDSRELFKCEKRIGQEPVRFITPACLYFYQRLAKGDLKKYDAR